MNPDNITQDPPKYPPSDRQRHKRKWLFGNPDPPRLRLLLRRFVMWVAGMVLVAALGGLWVWGSAEARAHTRVFRSAVEADLTRLQAVQNTYFSERERFASLDELGARYISSQGVRVRIHRADSTAWTGSAWHLLTSRICTLTVARRPAVQAEPGGRSEPVCR